MCLWRAGVWTTMLLSGGALYGCSLAANLGGYEHEAATDAMVVPDAQHERDAEPDALLPPRICSPEACGTGSGKANEPIFLCTPEEFLAITDNKNYRLCNDIDFSDVTIVPIKNLTGLLDGNDFTLRNVTATVGGNSSSLNPTGLFSIVGEGAEIRDLKLENWLWTGAETGAVGALVGKLRGKVNRVLAKCIAVDVFDGGAGGPGAHCGDDGRNQ